MRSKWKGSYLISGVVKHFVEASLKMVIDFAFRERLSVCFNNSFNIFNYLNDKGDLFFFQRAFFYNVNLFVGVVRFFLYNGRNFALIRQLSSSHGMVRFGEMSLTKQLGRKIHWKSILKRKQRRGMKKK